MFVSGDRGYAMAALLVGMAVMSIMLSMALPVWRTAVQREREAELIFRGEQYAAAIARFQGRSGGFPPSLDVLEKTKMIRKLYKDPITGEDFQPVYVGQVIPGAPVAPGQPGRGGQGAGQGGAQGRGRAGVPPGRTGQPPAAGGRGAPPAFQLGGRAGGQAGTIGAGPIIGVVSKSTAQSLRLYNGRGRYSEWAFVAVATTQQGGAPTGAQTPPGTPPGRGRGAQQPGARPGGPGRGLPGGMPPPGRGFPGRGGLPGRGNPFGPPPGFPPPGQ